MALTVCNAPVIIPFIARKFSTRESFKGSSPDYTITTIGGSGGNRKRNSTVLTTLNIADMTSSTSMANTVKVDVTEHELDRIGSWDEKKVSGDGDSSFEAPTPIKSNVPDSPV